MRCVGMHAQHLQLLEESAPSPCMHSQHGLRPGRPRRGRAGGRACAAWACMRSTCSHCKKVTPSPCMHSQHGLRPGRPRRGRAGGRACAGWSCTRSTCSACAPARRAAPRMAQPRSRAARTRPPRARCSSPAAVAVHPSAPITRNTCGSVAAGKRCTEQCLSGDARCFKLCTGVRA